jgi:hypothetical protein
MLRTERMLVFQTPMLRVYFSVDRCGKNKKPQGASNELGRGAVGLSQPISAARGCSQHAAQQNGTQYLYLPLLPKG